MLRLTGSTQEVNGSLMFNLAKDNFVVGESAVIFNGYSYAVAEYGIQVYTPCKFLDNFITPLRRFIYLEDYNTKVGFYESGIPSAERVICDFIKYPDKLGANLYLADILEGYYEDYGNFEDVYDMLSELNISHDLLIKWLQEYDLL